MKAYARPLILVLAAAALAASLGSLYVHYRLVRDPSYTSFCDVSATVNCEAVYQSAYGSMFGVPVAAGGAIWSGLVLLLAALGMRGPSSPQTAVTSGYIFLLSVIGLAAVFYFGYASFFVLRTLCLLCATVYVAVIGIFLASSSAGSVALSELPSRVARDLRSVFLNPTAATLAVVWLVASASLVAFFPREDFAAASAGSAAETYVAPIEALPPDQLAAWHRWLDAQPRNEAALPAGDTQVLLLKFNDYQCPACRQTWVEYKGIIEKYEASHPGAFRYESRDFPLEAECGAGGSHGAACEAAVAVRLARTRNKDRELEAWLFERQSTMTREQVKEGLEVVAQVTDFDEQYAKVLADVRADAQLGQRLGVNGTPTFFLNGIKMPSLRASYLDAAIAHELQKAAGGASGE